jgi:hypothetical protein
MHARSDLLRAILLLSISALAPGSAPGASEVRKRWFTPACAERDLGALTAIEQFSEIDEMPVAWLRDAGLSWLQARTHCLAGEEAEGLALYDRIIAGYVALPGALARSERVSR